jgi:hypothetical protein
MTTYQVHRLTPKGRANIKRGLARSWAEGGTHREKQKARGQNADADTVRARALDDRRGSEYATITMRGGKRFVLLWSVKGRRDQLDIFHAGGIIQSIRPSGVIATLEKFLQ